MPSHISPPSLPVGLVRQPLWNFSAHPWLLRHTGTLGRLNSNAVQNGERPKQIINSTKNATIDSRASEILGWFIQIGTCPLYFDGHQTFVRMGVLSGRHFVRTGLDVLSGLPCNLLPFLLHFAPFCSFLTLFVPFYSFLRLFAHFCPSLLIFVLFCSLLLLPAPVCLFLHCLAPFCFFSPITAQCSFLLLGNTWIRLGKYLGNT